MSELPVRRHLRHFEVQGGDCHVTWRLESGQAALVAEERTVVLDVIRRGEEFGCRFHAAVVMDDHVHALFRPGPLADSARLVQAWKSASSHKLCRLYGRHAPVWQREYYQRWLASPRLIDICASYIRANPRRKWQGVEGYRWLL